ncbi:hypothetical protein L484_004929 [Morus notabilis]|uniref:HIG1 domain-containing protein n=1 Tax=Morus notabilis TaxID=981085 RepID=W9S8B7_9ROSA|nr:hypothetical protein L484_004929 [Morus notabilis]
MAEPDFEDFLEKKRVRNPLVPVATSKVANPTLSAEQVDCSYNLTTTASPNSSPQLLTWGDKWAYHPVEALGGALLTAGVLTAGLISFRQGNSQLGQMLMRARVVVQGATVALMVGTAYYYGDNPWQSK